MMGKFTAPSSASLSSAPTEAAKPRRKRTIAAPKPRRRAPLSYPISPAQAEAGGDSHDDHGHHCASAVAAICEEIAQLQRIRRFCIRSQSRSDRSVESLIASMLGYHTKQTEKERKAVFRQASEIRKAVEKGRAGHLGFGTHKGRALSAIFPLILLSAAARKPWDDRREDAEANMKRLAAQLPVASWANGVRGFGCLNLAIVIGEAGIPIGDYRTVSGLWKRLGLAVIDGRSQRRVGGKEAMAHGFSPARRAEVYVVGSVSVFMSQRAGMPYREVYEQRRAHTLRRVEATADLPSGDPAKWTPKRCDNDARRVMTKALIRDLWTEWRRTQNSPDDGDRWHGR